MHTRKQSRHYSLNVKLTGQILPDEKVCLLFNSDSNKELIARYEKEPVYEFPAGFRMLAGDPDRRTLDVSDPAQDAVGYTCLGGTGHELDRQHGMTVFGGM